MKQTSVVIDACSLLNLCSSDRILCGLRELGATILLLPQVAAETLYVYKGGAGPDAKEKIAVDLDDLISQGILVPDFFRRAEEEALFVNLAGPLDDGEAACCAVAMLRQIRLLTDDGQAIKLMSARGFGGYVTTTPDVVKQVAETLGLDRESVRRILIDIQQRSRFVPPRHHSLSAWWETSLRTG